MLILSGPGTSRYPVPYKLKQSSEHVESVHVTSRYACSCKMDKFYDFTKFDWFSRVLKTVFLIQIHQGISDPTNSPILQYLLYLVVPLCDWPNLLSVGRCSTIDTGIVPMLFTPYERRQMMYNQLPLIPTGMIAPFFHFLETEFLDTVQIYPHRNIPFPVL
jgi:hypothetical protein